MEKSKDDHYYSAEEMKLIAAIFEESGRLRSAKKRSNQEMDAEVNALLAQHGFTVPK